jgi:hypothetical protein
MLVMLQNVIIYSLRADVYLPSKQSWIRQPSQALSRTTTFDSARAEGFVAGLPGTSHVMLEPPLFYHAQSRNRCDLDVEPGVLSLFHWLSTPGESGICLSHTCGKLPQAT